MYQKVITIIFISFIFLTLLVTKTNALTDIDPCPEATTPDAMVACYGGEDLDFRNEIWDCSEYVKEDETIDLETCRKDFGEMVDVKFDKIGYPKYSNWFWVSWARSAAWDKIMTIFDERQQERIVNSTLLPSATPTPTPTRTPTPTPTLRPDSAYDNNDCINRFKNGEYAGQNNYCFDIKNRLLICFNELPETDKIWACQNETGEVLNEEVCANSFLDYIGSQLLEVPNRCDYNGSPLEPEDWSSLRDDPLLIDGEIKNLRDIYREKNLARLTPSGTITPAVIDPHYLDETTHAETDNETVTEAYEILTCGFAGTNKDACCTNTSRDLLNPDLNIGDSLLRENQCSGWRSWVGACDFDLSEVAKTRFKDYLNSNENTAILNDMIENQGAIPQCFVGDPEPENDPETCKCEAPGPAKICQKYIAQKDNPGAYSDCVECMGDNGVLTKKFYTGFGCINSSFQGFINDVFTLGIGIAGVTTLFCIIYAAFIMQTSQNNPERIQKAQESITSCITGLILIIFAVFILRVIGVDLLRIPGFT